MFFTPQAERQQAGVMLDRRRRPPFDSQEGNDRQLTRLEEIKTRCAARAADVPLEELERQYRELAAAAPHDFFVPFQWGGILAARNRWEEAAPILTNALGQVPHHFEARVLPATALCRTGKPDEAAALVAGAGGPTGRYLAENTLAVMRALEAAGQIATAERFRREVLRHVPRFPLHRAIPAYPLGQPKS